MVSLGIMLSKLFQILALASLILDAKLTVSDPQYILVTELCSDTDFDLETTYRSNLNQLLGSLPTSASKASNNGYYATNTTSFAPSDPTIYGLFLCGGDTTLDDCKGCVSNAVHNLPPKDCPIDKSAVIWYDKCMVRYSNESFLGNVDETVAEGWKNHDYVSSVTDDVNGFMKLAGDTINNVTSTLISSPENNPGSGDRKYYLTKEVEFNSYVRLYTMVQCTPDLNPTACGMCLSVVINEMSRYCNGSKGCRMLNPSCNARYEIYHFYKDVLAPPPTLSPLSPPPPSPQAPPMQVPKGQSKPSRTHVIYISLGVVVLVLVVLVMVLIFLQCKKGMKYDEADVIGMNIYSRRNHAQTFENVDEDFMTAESLYYDFATLQSATNNFSDNQRLGEGGFGVVFKGTLQNGQDIAVKRLSKDSPQGSEQFKNEVLFVAKLQHKNLVQLLGFSLAPDEKLLVYEFVPNKSLNVFLFEKQGRLNWSQRYKIIHGIARGILYLHEDSRLKIIHRDLKASNILLDDDMNPKISDFGLARNFALNQKQDQTSRLAGTLGYMAPEYIEYGEISTKSDVYSFGVLVLEIITGMKISHRQHLFAENLLTYVWRHWKEGTPMKVVDASLEDTYTSNEVIRCLHLGLLCVQGNIEERPSMLSIVSYLNSSFNLPTPQQPAFALIIQKGSSSGTGDVVTDKSTKSGYSS